MSPHSVTTWPHIHATMNPDGSAHLTTNGINRDFTPAPPEETRQAIIEAVTETAQEFNRSVRLHTTGPDGDWVLIITPTGNIETETGPPAGRKRNKETPPMPVVPASPVDPRPISQLRLQSVDTPPTAKHVDPTPDPAGSTAPAVPRRRAEVNTVLYPEQELTPVESGWRSILARVGIRIKPSVAELARRDDIAAVSQHWPGLRTVLIASPKGAANKTPTTALLSAAFARRGGAGVVAWDNNETRGTLPWRTEKSSHDATVLDLLKDVEKFKSETAQAGMMAHYLHHQAADRYDVLWSDQSIDGDHKISGEEFDKIHAVLGKYYRMLFLDSGNGERDENFIAAVAKADQLVVPVVASKDVLEGAERMLDRLHGQGGHAEKLAQNAIGIVSQRYQGTSVAEAVETMRSRVKDLVVVPFDHSLVDGMIWFDALQPASQKAWEHAAATVARNL